MSWIAGHVMQGPKRRPFRPYRTIYDPNPSLPSYIGARYKDYPLAESDPQLSEDWRSDFFAKSNVSDDLRTSSFGCRKIMPSGTSSNTMFDYQSTRNF